jgi:stearoyl-CoA desaturase (delta-9 desaturase)
MQRIAPTGTRTGSYGSPLPFYLAHVVALVGPVFVGVSWGDLALCAGLYVLRMFGVTAGLHRYFSHRSYKTSRGFQLLLALLGTTAIQKGVLWWAAHHRHHHKHSDTERDIHSVRQSGFWHAHIGWFLSREHEATQLDRVRDLARYPELVWLDRHHPWVALAFAAALFAFGGASAVVWGFFVSTVLLWHGTFTINSLCHVFGSRRYETGEDSKNSLVLALITLGEGWHNNHHYYQSSANQGFFWWEIDLSYYALRALAAVGLVWDLRRPPARVLSGAGPRGAEAAPQPETRPDVARAA